MRPTRRKTTTSMVKKQTGAYPRGYRFRVRVGANAHPEIVADLERPSPSERNERVQWLLGIALAQLKQIKNGSAAVLEGQTTRRGNRAVERIKAGANQPSSESAGEAPNFQLELQINGVEVVSTTGRTESVPRVTKRARKKRSSS